MIDRSLIDEVAYTPVQTVEGYEIIKVTVIDANVTDRTYYCLWSPKEDKYIQLFVSADNIFLTQEGAENQSRYLESLDKVKILFKARPIKKVREDDLDTYLITFPSINGLYKLELAPGETLAQGVQYQILQTHLFEIKSKGVGYQHVDMDDIQPGDIISVVEV